jgi:hypothetical protein
MRGDLDKQQSFFLSLHTCRLQKKSTTLGPDADVVNGKILVVSKIEPLQGHETCMKSEFPAISKGRKMTLRWWLRCGDACLGQRAPCGPGTHREKYLLLRHRGEKVTMVVG